MAKWTFTAPSFTPAATADNQDLGDNTHMSLQGANSAQRMDIMELYLGGQAPSVSSPCIMLFARDFQVATGTLSMGGGARNGAIDPGTSALAAPQIPFTAATTNKPRRTTTLATLNLSFNAYGGLVRWFAPDQGSVIKMLGNVASFGEMSLSAYSGSTVGPMGAHIIYETI